MYESFFELSQCPFTTAPRIDRYYPGEAIEAARVALARCVDRAEGYGLVIGPAGTGKTLLCQVLAEQFTKTLAPVLLSGIRITTRKALLQAILYELGLPYRRREEGELRLALIDFLTPGAQRPDGMLLLVDEAHLLPAKLCEELRLLTNIVRQGRPRVRLVLAGAAALEERLAHPRLVSFQQRVAVRCALRPFSAAETHEYVRAQTAAAGGDPESLWTEDALSMIRQTTDGVPRLINQLCDHALLLAAAEGLHSLDSSGIERAWADLQQLPAPSGERRDIGSAKAGTEEEEQAVIEFGTLDDEPSADTAEVAAAALPSSTVLPMSPPAVETVGAEISFPGGTLRGEPLGDVGDEAQPAQESSSQPSWPHEEDVGWQQIPTAHATLIRHPSNREDDPVLPERTAEAVSRRRPRHAVAHQLEPAMPAVVALRPRAATLFEPVPIIVEDEPSGGPAGTRRFITADVVFEEETPLVMHSELNIQRTTRGSGPAFSESVGQRESDAVTPRPSPTRHYRQLFSTRRRGLST